MDLISILTTVILATTIGTVIVVAKITVVKIEIKSISKLPFAV
jgi:hypothetical protein